VRQTAAVITAALGLCVMSFAGCGSGEADSTDAIARVLVRAEGSSHDGNSSTRVTPEFQPENAWQVDWKLRCDDDRHDDFDLAVLDRDNAIVAHATSDRSRDSGRLTVALAPENFRLRVTSRCTFSADASESPQPG